MTSRSEVQQVHIFLSYYLKKYKAKYGFAAVVNRNRTRWSVSNMLMDMTLDDAKGLLDFYFDTVGEKGHDLEWFLYNYDKLQVAKEKRDKDAAALAHIRAESKRRAEEWRKKIGNN